MLIVATQDNYLDEQWCIWNTVSDQFIGVNLSKEEAVQKMLEYKGNAYTKEDAIERVERAQKFSDIARVIDDVIPTLEQENKRFRQDRAIIRTRCMPGAEKAFDKKMYGLLHIQKIEYAQVSEIGQDTLECAIFYKCMRCGNGNILQGYKYCSKCGKMIDWGA